MFIIATLSKRNVVHFKCMDISCCLVTDICSTHAKGVTHMSAEIHGMFVTLVWKVWKTTLRYEGCSAWDADVLHTLSA